MHFVLQSINSPSPALLFSVLLLLLLGILTSELRVVLALNTGSLLGRLRGSKERVPCGLRSFWSYQTFSTTRHSVCIAST